MTEVTFADPENHLGLGRRSYPNVAYKVTKAGMIATGDPQR